MEITASDGDDGARKHDPCTVLALDNLPSFIRGVRVEFPICLPEFPVGSEMCSETQWDMLSSRSDHNYLIEIFPSMREIAEDEGPKLCRSIFEMMPYFDFLLVAE